MEKGIKSNSQLHSEVKKVADSYDPEYLRIRWDAIMRGTWVLVVVVARMVLKVWGLGADGRMALGMFWKSIEEGGKPLHMLIGRQYKLFGLSS